VSERGVTARSARTRARRLGATAARSYGFAAAAALALIATAAPGAAHAEDVPLRDPTRPYEAQPATDARGSAAHRLELSAVLISPQRRVAVINGKLYHEGELVDGATISRIESQAVHLRRGSEERVVQLGPERAGAQTNQGDSTR
jgi:hypothetical protein